MDKIKIRLFGTDGVDFCHQFYNWNFGKSEYKNIQIVSDNSYTHAVLFGIPKVDLKNIPKENVIGIQCEPYEIYDINSYINYFKNVGSTYYCSIRPNTIDPTFKEGITYLAPYPLQLIQPSYIDNKSFKMSMIASNKTDLEGHKLRHKVIRKILDSDLDIHIYGRNLEYMYGKSDSRIKGTLQNKFDGLIPYEYTISIENVYDFISEKLYDPILFDSIPLYCGDIGKLPNIFTFGVIPITTDINTIFPIIKEVFINTTKNDYNTIMRHTNKIKTSIFNYEFNLCEFLYKQFNKVNDG